MRILVFFAISSVCLVLAVTLFSFFFSSSFFDVFVIFLCSSLNFISYCLGDEFRYRYGHGTTTTKKGTKRKSL